MKSFSSTKNYFKNPCTHFLQDFVILSEVIQSRTYFLFIQNLNMNFKAWTNVKKNLVKNLYFSRRTNFFTWGMFVTHQKICFHASDCLTMRHFWILNKMFFFIVDESVITRMARRQILVSWLATPNKISNNFKKSALHVC